MQLKHILSHSRTKKQMLKQMTIFTKEAQVPGPLRLGVLHSEKCVSYPLIISVGAVKICVCLQCL